MAERLDAEGLERRLGDLLRLPRKRASVVVVEVEPGACDLAAALVERVAGDTRPLVHVVGNRPPDDAALSSLNRERDLRLKAERLLVLVAPGVSAVRRMRRVAPDLTAAPDLWVALGSNGAGGSGWSELGSRVRALMEERHRSLDFTGLLPGSVERRTVPLDGLFMELVDLAPPSREERRPVLVLADPGAGKTTLLRHLALTYATGRGDPLGAGPAVPLLIPLADYAHSRERDRVRPLADYLPVWLAEQGIETGGPIDLADLVLLLDGLDEMREPTARRAVLEEAGAMCADGRVAALVLTGRSFLIDELRSADLVRFRIAGCKSPDKDQVRRYLRGFVAQRGVPGADRIADEVGRAIQSDPDLRELARTPLMLLFLALLHELEGRLPDRRVEIYGRLGELLVERWVRARSIGSGGRSRRASRGDAMRVLGPLAWWVVERGGGALPADELEARLVELESRREGAVEGARRARELLDLLQRDSALLRAEPGHRWAFVHPSVAEFFAGRDAERDPDRWRALLADPFRASWREIALFAAGVVGIERGSTARLDEMVEAVLAGTRRRGRYDSRHPSLLIGLLREDPGLTATQRRALLRRLGEFWFTSAFVQASARKVQVDAVAFLEAALGTGLQSDVATELGRWFTPESVGVRWERLLAAARDDLSENAVEEEIRSEASYSGHEYDPAYWEWLVGSWAHAVAPPLARALPRLLPEYGIDPAPLRALLDGHPDWRLRWARR